MSKQAILLKVTGELFLDPATKQLCRTHADSIAKQLKQLCSEYAFSIVIGGGAFFRGNEHSNGLALRPATAHAIGMIATTMSSLILYDILRDHGIKSTVLNAFDCSLTDKRISQQAIDCAQDAEEIIIFGGGTGSPFVSTDTSAIIRAKQVGASQVWKATTVSGAYSADPRSNKSAQLIKQLNCQDVLDKKLTFMDHTAIILAKQEQIVIRVFDIFAPNALINAAHDKNVGSTIQA